MVKRKLLRHTTIVSLDHVGDRDETIHHRISEYCKQEHKDNRLDWMRKVIHWELCKKFKYDNTNLIVHAQPTKFPKD